MKFKFRLEKLLEIRKNEKDKKYAAWSIENSKLNKIIEEEIAVKAELAKNKKEYSEFYKSKNIQGINLLGMYISTFKKKILEVQSRIEEQKNTIEQFRVDFHNSNIEFKTIEKLKESKKAEYIKIENKKEENFIDELNVMRHNRGKTIGSI